MAAHQEALTGLEADMGLRLERLVVEKDFLVDQAEHAKERMRATTQELLETDALLLVVSQEREQLERDLGALRQNRKEEEEKEDRAKCTVCMDNQVDCKLSGCPHLFCLICVQKFPRKQCPNCRRVFKKAEEVYF
jgi:hypothetical protein